LEFVKKQLPSFVRLRSHRLDELLLCLLWRDRLHVREYLLHLGPQGLEHLADALGGVDAMEIVLLGHGLKLGEQTGLVFHERLVAVPIGQETHPRFPVVKAAHVQHAGDQVG
jgi:hypothetical protein